MNPRAFVVASLLLAACYKDKPRTEGPPSNGGAQVAARVDYSATIADPLGFLPVDSEVVIGVDVDQVKKSMFWPPVAARISQAGGSAFTNFKQVCGFDPMETVRAMSLGMKNIGKPTPPEGVLVVHGIDRSALMTCMDKGMKAGGKVQIENDIVTVRSDDGSAVAFAFVDASTVVGVIGPSASSAQLKAVLAAGAPLRSSPAFADLVAKTNLEASGWIVMNGNASVFDQMAQAVGSRPKAAFGSVSVLSGVVMDLHLRLDSPAQAQQLSTMANGQAGMARAMFTKLDITTENADVVVALSMTDQQLTNILQMAGVSLAAP